MAIIDNTAKRQQQVAEGSTPGVQTAKPTQKPPVKVTNVEVGTEFAHQHGYRDEEELKDILLKFAKKQVLAELAENFDSQIFSNEAIQKFAKDYISDLTNNSTKEPRYKNQSELFSSYLEMGLENNYKGERFGNITNDIIFSIICDLKTFTEEEEKAKD